MGIPRVRRQVEGMRLLEEPPYRHAISQPWGSTESRMSFHLVMQSRMRDSCCKWCAWSIGGISSSFFFFVFSTISNWEEWSHFALYNKMFCKWAKEKKKRNTYIRDPAESLRSPKRYLNFTVLSLCGYFFPLQKYQDKLVWFGGPQIPQWLASQSFQIKPPKHQQHHNRFVLFHLQEQKTFQGQNPRITEVGNDL